MPSFPVPSSPLSSPPLTQSISREVSASQETKNYRQPRPLPYELEQYVKNYVEESLFTLPLNLLLSTVANGNNSSLVTIPSPAYLALATTVSIHPGLTTRAKEREKRDQANAALRLLKLVNSLVGPVNAKFNTGFTFRKYHTRWRQAEPKYDEDEDGDPIERDAYDENDIKSKYARSQSLWVKADDFWHLVGWAFNCACLPKAYAARWAHYRLLLEFMVGVLETDWQIKSDASPEESLLWQYIELSESGHAKERRIVRAIFADGSTNSMREFKEIFNNELKQPKVEDYTIKKTGSVDIDKEEYGDYFREESDVSDEDNANGQTTAHGRPSKRMRARTRTPSSRGVTPRSSTGSLRSAYTTDGDTGDLPTHSSPTLGDRASLPLRLRLLKLLTYVSTHPTLTSTSPTTFPDLEDLLTLFVEFIRPLHLPVFAQIMLPSPSGPFDTPLTLHLCEAILQRMLEHSAPSGKSHVLLSQKKLEEEYLPFAASKNTIDANARVSILLESLTRSLASIGALQPMQELCDAVELGLQNRRERVADLVERKGNRKRKAGEDTMSWDWLVESGKRMTLIVQAWSKQEE